MKKAVIPVSFDAEKLSAAKLYMAQKDLSFEEEMEKAADALSCLDVGSTDRFLCKRHRHIESTYRKNL